MCRFADACSAVACRFANAWFALAIGDAELGLVRAMVGKILNAGWCIRLYHLIIKKNNSDGYY